MTAAEGTELIEVKVQSVHQLFNSMDPSPFHQRDLDDDAEQFIIGWAQEHSIRTPLKLVVHLGEPPDRTDIAESIHHYFAYRVEMNRREFRLLMREGWISLLIGFAFLALCVTAAQTLTAYMGSWHSVMNEGLTIIGWVAMWGPLDIYLYRWWPVRHLGKVYRKLSEIPVEIRISG